MNDPSSIPDREIAGPFIILGIDKDADDALIAAKYEQQKQLLATGQLAWSLADLEWARSELRDPKRRLLADLNSLDVDLASGEIHRLARVYNIADNTPGWEPIDPEPPIDLLPAGSIVVDEIVASVPGPDVPLELPAINRWLEQFAKQVTDPWTIELAG